MMSLDTIVRKLASGARNIAIGASLAIALSTCYCSDKRQPMREGEFLAAKIDNEKESSQSKESENADFLKEIKDLGRIYFVSNRDGQWDIYSMKPDGSDVIRVTNTLGRESNLAVSPNGEYLAFDMPNNSDKSWHIYIMDLKTKEVYPFIISPYRDIQPAWSPKGDKIYFTRDFGLFDLEICVGDTEGKVRLLTKNDENISDFCPAQSPNGEEIAYIRNEVTTNDNIPDNISKNSSICIMKKDGSVNRENNGKIVSGLGESYYKLAWSPSGEKIACGAFLNRRDQIIIFNPDGTNIESLNYKILSKHKVVSPEFSAKNPSWHPTMDYLIFTMSETPHKYSDICLAKADGSFWLNITNSDFVEDEAVWGP